MNYPDDIRNFDNHPQSPFFVDPNAWQAVKAAEMAEEWLDELAHTGSIGYEDWSWADLVILMTEEEGTDPDNAAERFHYLEAHILKMIEGNPDAFDTRPKPEDLQWD
jgi:hypothetical protein